MKKKNTSFVKIALKCNGAVLGVSGIDMDHYTFRIADNSNRTMMISVISEMDISFLPSGVYTLQLLKDDEATTLIQFAKPVEAYD